MCLSKCLSQLLSGHLHIDQAFEEKSYVLAFHILSVGYVEEFTDHGFDFFFEFVRFVVMFVVLISFHDNQLVCNVQNGLDLLSQGCQCLLGLIVA